MANEINRQTGSKQVIRGLLALGFILFGLGLLFAPTRLDRPGSLGGTNPPEIVFHQPQSEGDQKLSEQRGKVVLLNFWAEWCAPCLEEMPSLRALERLLEGRPFVLWMVHVGESENRLSEMLLPKNVLWDVPTETLLRFGVSALPHAVLIDKTGTVSKEFLGPRDWTSPRIRSAIEALF